MILWYINTVALEPNRNLQDSIYCFSLAIGRVFYWQQQVVKIYKMLVDMINCKIYIRKRQKDKYNMITFEIELFMTDNTIKMSIKHKIYFNYSKY